MEMCWEMVRFPYKAERKKSYTKKWQQDFMVRQINKGYGELQVMHLDLTSDETDGPGHGITRFKVTSADIKGDSQATAVCSQINTLRGNCRDEVHFLESSCHKKIHKT